MPQLVSFFNATGGAASALVALIEFSNPDNESALVTLLGLVIGSIAFSGSMIAYGKLNGNVKDIFQMDDLHQPVILAGVVVLLILSMIWRSPPGKQDRLLSISSGDCRWFMGSVLLCPLAEPICLLLSLY